MGDDIFQIGLSLVKGVGFVLWKELINKFESAEKVFEANREYLDFFIKKGEIVDEIIGKNALKKAEKLVLEHKRNGVKIISFFDEEYPYRLKQIYNPPCFLYCLGENIMNNSRILGIVGTRNPTEYGKKNVEKFVCDLHDYDVVIVSGLAYGIDVLGHKAALRNNVRTLAVLAGGVDKIYPREHKSVYNEIINSGGCVISENPLKTGTEAFRFPLRNRIIAGISDAILVVEAGNKSGTEITAMCANDYDREVFAIPGNIDSDKSFGCNNLIKTNKAHLVENAEDIAKIMNWNKNNSLKIHSDCECCMRDIELDLDEKMIYNIVKKNSGISFDEIVEKTEIERMKVSMILLKLEIDNLITLLPGDKYK